MFKKQKNIIKFISKVKFKKKKYEQAIDLCNSQNISLSHQTKNLQYEVL